MAALEASREMETGKVASRASPVPGPTLERGAWASNADPGIQGAMADQATPWAMLDPGTRAAIADQGTPWAMAGSPPPQNFLGEIAVWGAPGKRRPLWVLWEHRLFWALWQSGHRNALWRSGNRGVLASSGLWRSMLWWALGRSARLRVLVRSGYCSALVRSRLLWALGRSGLWWNRSPTNGVLVSRGRRQITHERRAQ